MINCNQARGPQKTAGNNKNSRKLCPDLLKRYFIHHLGVECAPGAILYAKESYRDQRSPEMAVRMLWMRMGRERTCTMAVLRLL